MKKRGFTLIELLAVIVILAIIALITIPLMTGITKNSRKESNERSIDLFANALRNSITNWELSEGKEVEAGTYCTSATLCENVIPFKVESIDNVECGIVQIYEDGNFYLDECTVKDKKIDYTYGVKIGLVKHEDSEDDIQNSTGIGVIDLGDIITIGTEKFYVMFNENNKITMLSMYNLDVGGIYYQANYTTLTNPTGIQNPEARGYVLNSDNRYYGGIEFGNSFYWVDSNSNLKPEYGTSYPVDVYDENSALYQHVEKYEQYLKSQGAISAEASLVNLEQANRILSMSVPEWAFSTTYWLGFAVDEYAIQYIRSNGSIDNYMVSFPHEIGLRPVVTISVDEIAE